ncbi:MAG: Zn-ribbon domain-containing OB-fold protein [Candidatus Bathyarchaeota archaeon]|jgi:uncharacterized OB-fold protein
MSFNRFGKISYISETKVSDFVDYLKDGKIMATRCNRCGRLYFPPRADCPDDLYSDMRWEQLSGKCRLLTFTTAYFAPTGFEEDAPYTIALAKCEEGVKVYALLNKAIKIDELSVGMDLVLTPLQLVDNRITYQLVKA